MDINFNDWEFHELSKELNDMAMHQMLDKYKQLEADMTTIAVNHVGSHSGNKSENEQKYDALHRQQVYVAVRIANEMTGL